ncbi:MAG: adenylate/guanylate cyclase domain-containing protein, partial [Gaiellaceae bacterium]
MVERIEPLVRKTVTVLFCDVTGSTSLGERIDPETLRRVMLEYFDEMRAAIERHGGTVEKFIGDAVMAVFGVPVVHEDDALRAVRA